MSRYDSYDSRRGERGSHRYYEDYQPRDSGGYLSPHGTSQDLIPRRREDSDYSVEEIRRDFPPPGYKDVRRARSAEPYYDGYDDRRSHYSRDDRDRDYRRDRDRGSLHIAAEEKTRRRVLSKQEKIIAAVVGGALAVGAKEVYDRREAKTKEHDITRNPLASAALGAAGAFATYQGAEFYNKKAGSKEETKRLEVHKGRDGRLLGYYSEDEDDGKEEKGHKNFLEKALAAAGLGGAIKALGGASDDKKSDTRSRRGSRSRSRSKEGGANKIQKAAMASLIAGATEAFRVSKEPGGWKGEKAKRVFTAAAGAATIDAAQKDGGSKMGLAESVVGGLLGNRVLHGSRKNIEEDKATGRSRSRSRARSASGGGGGGGGLAGLAAAGLGALGAKKIYDNQKERSQSRRRDYSDDDDSRGGSPDRRKRSRSRSVVDTARRSLAKLGIGNGPDDDRDRDSDRGDRHRSRRYSDDYDDDYRDRGHGGRHRDYDDDDRSYRGGGRERSRSRGGGRRRSSRGSRTGSESELGDSSEDEKKARKMRDRRR